MNLLPLFLKLEGRNGIVAGAGSVALEKLETLLTTGVRLRVIAPEARSEVRALHAAGRIEMVERAIHEDDLEGAFLAIAATNNPAVNADFYRAAVKRGILVNSVDDPPHCDFYFGSVVRRGDLQIAISTAGESPAVAQLLRREIDEQLPQDLGPWLARLGALRRELLQIHPAGAERKALLHSLARRESCDSTLCSTRRAALAPLAANDTAKVALVGAGPGDPELLTIKALRWIEAAQVILHDELVSPAILALASASAEVVNVGKRCGTKNITQPAINQLMLDRARQGLCVVRLKSGDPMLFGRASEEMAALDEAGLRYEIVPGISSGFAAAAALGTSLTSRSTASQLVISTGSHAATRDAAKESTLDAATRVVYMPGRDLSPLAARWLAEGLDPETPCDVVSHVSRVDQRVIHTTLDRLASVRDASAPSIVMAGWALWESARVRSALAAILAPVAD